MSTKPIYETYRTDNIETLFNIVFYLQLLDDCEDELRNMKRRLVAEFNQFPVQFDKERNASRFSYPYRYNESGIVTISGNDHSDIEDVVLDPWIPENRPQPKEKRKTNQKPRYNQLLDNYPIWFLQLMRHENRKTVAHRNTSPNKHADYGSVYKKLRILNTLPNDEQAPFTTRDIDVANAIECRQTIRPLGTIYQSYRMAQTDDKITPFFFLNAAEIQELSEAIQSDNLSQKINNYYYNGQTHKTIRNIITNPPTNRVSIDIQPLLELTKSLSAVNPERPYQQTHKMEILKHEVVWETLHEQYVELADEHLHLLREFNLLNDELLQEIKDAQAQKEEDHVIS